MKYFVSYRTIGMTIPPIMADECPEPRHHDNLDPTWGIERLAESQSAQRWIENRAVEIEGDAHGY